jgi:hypothetical protein
MITFTLDITPFERRLQGAAQAVIDAGAGVVEATAKDVWSDVMRTSPVDTGALRRSWSVPRPHGSPLRWSFGSDAPYAAVLEYGGYRHVGPKTVASSGDPGEDFVASPGIYSRQAPLGFVRRALAGNRAVFRRRLQAMLGQAWGSGREATGWPGATAAPLGATTDIGTLFGIDILGGMAQGGLSPQTRAMVQSILHQTRARRSRRKVA